MTTVVVVVSSRWMLAASQLRKVSTFSCSDAQQQWPDSQKIIKPTNDSVWAPKNTRWRIQKAQQTL